MKNWIAPSRMIVRRLVDGTADFWFEIKNPPHTVPRANNPVIIETAISRGLDFLSRNQRRDGAFVDFLLPPGASDVWVTAHAAWVLENVPEFDQAHSRAAKYLRGIGIQHEGRWGYNNVVGHDCDSTAQALMVLNHANLDIPPSWIADFRSKQHPRGGFPTFVSNKRPETGWQAQHPDVTLVVLEALRRLDAQGASIAFAHAWLEQLYSAGGLHSYWWKSPAYILWAAKRAGFRTLEMAPLAHIALEYCQTTPDLPMLLGAALPLPNLRDSILFNRSVEQLIASQLSDGSWKCAPCLRLTDPGLHEARATLDGRLYAGNRRVISTAHSVAVLSEILYPPKYQ